jgi:hypothetical protein
VSNRCVGYAVIVGIIVASIAHAVTIAVLLTRVGGVHTVVHTAFHILQGNKMFLIATIYDVFIIICTVPFICNKSLRGDVKIVHH